MFTRQQPQAPSGAQPAHVLLPHGGGTASPFGSPGPTGLTPTQVRHAYGFDQITFANGTIAGDGAGTTAGALEVNVRREIQRLLPQIIAEELGDARRRR